MKSHAVRHNVDFSTLQILSRKQLVQLLTKYYQMDFLKPRLHSVHISGGTVATMTVFDVKALLIAFLNNPYKMWYSQHIKHTHNMFRDWYFLTADLLMHFNQNTQQILIEFSVTKYTQCLK